MTMKTRMPTLVATAMAVILVAANAPQNRVTPHAPSTPQQEGPRAGNSECAPSSANPNDARYSCPQNRTAEPSPAPTF
jgi:hypothetical protein